MEDVLFQLFPHLRQQGVKDYDDLTPVEQAEYRKMLEIQEKGQITLEDFKRHVHAMRQSVEYEMVRILKDDPRFQLYQARLQNYLLFEAFFDRPERAKQMLEQYKARPSSL